MTINPKMQMLVQMLKNKNDPQALVMSIVKQQTGSNPIISNLIELAEQGDGASVEQVARNLLASQGLDFDKEFKDFQSLIY